MMEAPVAKTKTLQDLFHDTLKDIYFAEKKILTALPKMAKAANSDELRAAFAKHARETEGQVKRLEQVPCFWVRPRRPRPAMRSWGSSRRARKS
jgi:ferritin-like metal-binding protein YciE